MATAKPTNYHFPGGLEQALVDLIRVGATGHSSGVRQLAARLIRAVPPEVDDPETFRRAVHGAVTASASAQGLRFGRGEIPEDGETHPLVDVDADPDGSGLVLAPGPQSQLQEIVVERDRSAELARAGITPTRSVLLSGPPGVGKTLAAKWLADTLNLPLVSLDLASVVSSYLGSSGRNIKAVLKYAQTGPCVLLLDEFDAVAKRRDDDTDIGELKRIVNVLLVELDKWSEVSLLVAATNHPQLLDPAVGRRFDRHIELDLPTVQEVRVILGNMGGEALEEDVLDVAAQALTGLSGSAVVRTWELAQRRAILNGTQLSIELIREVLWHDRSSGPERDRLWMLASLHLGMSARQIAVEAKVSHPTVSAALKRAKEHSHV